MIDRVLAMNWWNNLVEEVKKKLIEKHKDKVLFTTGITGREIQKIWEAEK